MDSIIKVKMFGIVIALSQVVVAACGVALKLYGFMLLIVCGLITNIMIRKICGRLNAIRYDEVKEMMMPIYIKTLYLSTSIMYIVVYIVLLHIYDDVM